MRIDHFDGSSNQFIGLKAVSGGWDYKNGIVIEPAGGGNLTDMVNFFNSILDYPANRGGKLEHFLDRFYFSTDPADDHILMLTAKNISFKINAVSFLPGSQISNGGPLEAVSVTGAPGNELTLQIGAEQGQCIKIAADKIDAISLGVYGLNIINHIQADDAISRLGTAMDHVSNVRSKLGAYQNRLEAAIRNINNTSENTSIAESRIKDTDIAKEMVAYSTNHILTQAAHAMLAQAQKQPQQVLMLLQ